MKMKPITRVLLIVLTLVGVYGIVKYSGLSIFQRALKDTVALSTVALPDAPKDQKGENVAKTEMPQDEPASINSKQIIQKIMAWNSQMGLIYSVGGKVTSKNSLMEQHGVNIKLERQDDTEQMKAEIIKNAKEYKDNPEGTPIMLISIMGTGVPSWLAGVNEELKKLGPDYIAKGFYSMGKSLGEDGVWVPQAVKDDPSKLKGIVISCFVRDGDQHLVDILAASSDIELNVDPKTYFPDGINFVEASDFVDAGQKYITGYSEDRPVVQKNPKTGKMEKTGEIKHVVVQGVATWTPSDVAIAEKKGGLVRMVSTLDYQAQMPNITIGILKETTDHRKIIDEYISAALEGGDQVKTYSEALDKAGELSAKVYGEKDGSYWVKYYRGVKQSDATGVLVDLGGSRVHNLADNLEYFGMGKNKTNIFASVYKTFGDFDVKLYPEFVKSYPPFSEAMDFSFLNDVKNMSKGNMVAADKIKYDSEATDIRVVSKKNWAISFATGSDQLTAAGIETLKQVNAQMLVANALRIELEGFTDNVGDPKFNQYLSEKRAKSVKNWLQSNSPELYPDERFVKVIGKGQENPIASNITELGRAKNRRVTVILGQ